MYVYIYMYIHIYRICAFLDRNNLIKVDVAEDLDVVAIFHSHFKILYIYVHVCIYICVYIVTCAFLDRDNFIKSDVAEGFDVVASFHAYFVREGDWVCDAAREVVGTHGSAQCQLYMYLQIYITGAHSSA